MATKRYKSVDGLRHALRAMPKESRKAVREEAYEITVDVASAAAGRAQGIGRQAKHVAPKIRPRKQDEPEVRMAGRAAFKPSSGRKGARIADIMWGAEFGGYGYAHTGVENRYRSPSRQLKTTGQFLPHLGPTGYFLWPTIREMDIEGRYLEALYGAARRAR